MDESSVAADPGYDIVLLAGQSNMSGRGTPFSRELDPLDPRIDQWGTHGRLGIKPATEPLDMHDVPSGIGPGLQFARWYAAARPAPQRKVLLVPTAHGGTPLSSDDSPLGWRWGVPGNLAENAVTQTLAAKRSADAVPGTTNRIVAILWLQGETDGDRLTPSETYRADLDALIAGLRRALDAPEAPFIVGTMAPEYLSTGTRAHIDVVHRDTPNRVARTDVAVAPIGMTHDDGNHFNAAGARFIGRAMFEAFERVSDGTAAMASGG